MKKVPEAEKENSERWLLTYSDLITLLMIFFIVLYSMSKVDQVKYQQLAKGLNMAMGGGKTLIGTSLDSSVKDTPVPDVSPTPQNQQATVPSANQQTIQMKELKGEIDKYLKANGLSVSAQTAINERGLVVSLKDSALFDTGKADIKKDAAAKLVKIGKILSSMQSYVRVEGHTDNVPIHTYQFSSNWQLSAARATNVVELLIGKANISPEKISAVGYGEYRAIANNSTPQGRAKNRRVDILVMNSKYDKFEDSNKN